MTVYMCEPCNWRGNGDTRRAHEDSAEHKRNIARFEEVERIAEALRVLPDSVRALVARIVDGGEQAVEDIMSALHFAADVDVESGPDADLAAAVRLRALAGD